MVGNASSRCSYLVGSIDDPRRREARQAAHNPKLVVQAGDLELTGEHPLAGLRVGAGAPTTRSERNTFVTVMSRFEIRGAHALIDADLGSPRLRDLVRPSERGGRREERADALRFPQ